VSSRIFLHSWNHHYHQEWTLPPSPQTLPGAPGQFFPPAVPIPLHPWVTTHLLSLTRDWFAIPPIPLLGGGLISFTQHNCCEIVRAVMFILFYCWAVFYCMAIPRFVYGPVIPHWCCFYIVQSCYEYSHSPTGLCRYVPSCLLGTHLRGGHLGHVTRVSFTL
jgi:hypothetical protein